MTDRAKVDERRIEVEDDRTGMSPETIERAIFDHIYYTCSKDFETATNLDLYKAVASMVRDRLTQRWIKTQRTYYETEAKRAYYLSAEFLLGRALQQNLLNLGIYDEVAEILARKDVDLADLLEEEMDPGLGNGGLGRLAACFMDSMATLGLPGRGYGIRYEFGIFKQEIVDGRQVEHCDNWARYGNVWEMPRYEYSVPVNFGGSVEEFVDMDGRLTHRWVNTRTVIGVPYDMPVAGYDSDNVNTVRLWSARATNEFDLEVFNDGDYRRAVEEKALSESISKVLYPNDRAPEGRELRLKQQYFFVCCSLHDIIRRFHKKHEGFSEFPDKVAIQLNDTHPAVAVAELMRLLLDVHGLGWEQAWSITQRTIAFTNHTLLPEALEKWDLPLFQRLLPRHTQIIFEINRRFLREVHIFAPNDQARQRRMSIIEEGPHPTVRMAYLAVVGSHSVNGVAALHSELLKEHLLRDFYELYPDRFNNKTNGVTPRRWLLQANPKLAELIKAKVGDDWPTNLDKLKDLTQFIDDADFLNQLQAIKRHNKEVLAQIIWKQHGIRVNLDSIFDVQVKRLHEYKRQLLNTLHIITLYRQLKANPNQDFVPRTFIFGGKAAPGYAMAKLHIKLINDVASIINNDPVIGDRIKVVFLSNYGVSLAERIFPASDISEQISMAGKEASGTGNMKFMMNGALTLGTLDGANIEIREAAGDDNFFLFGLTSDQVRELKDSGYQPQVFIHRSPELQATLELIDSGFFSPDQPGRFQSIVQHLRTTDTYMHCADFESYMERQREVAETYQNQRLWTQKVVHNLAHCGVFSSDRTIQQYAEEIWQVKPIRVKL